MIPLREVDLLGILVSPASICLVAGVAASLAFRRALDLTPINRFVWNRALFDFAVLVAITSLLVLSLRFGGT